jgi:hypothetical protein
MRMATANGAAMAGMAILGSLMSIFTPETELIEAPKSQLYILLAYETGFFSNGFGDLST